MKPTHSAHGRARTRGVTLIEVMIVVTIMGLIAGGVALAVFPVFLKKKIELTHVNARVLRNAAGAWRADHGEGNCPTPSMLREAELVDLGSKLDDAWGTPFRIVCRESQTIVISLGPDKKEGADDIVEPEPIAMEP